MKHCDDLIHLAVAAVQMMAVLLSQSASSQSFKLQPFPLFLHAITIIYTLHIKGQFQFVNTAVSQKTMIVYSWCVCVGFLC